MQRKPIITISWALKCHLSDNYSARVPITTDTISANGEFDIVRLSNVIKNDDFLKKQIIGIDQVSDSEMNQFELSTRVGDQKIILGICPRWKRKLRS